MNLNILLVYLVLSVILLIIEIHATSTESPQTNNSSDSVSISTSVVTGMSFQYKSENKKVFYGTNGQPSIGEGEDVKITMYGSFPKTKLKVLVTTRKSCDHPGDKCKYVSASVHSSRLMATVKLKLPKIENGNKVIAYICLKDLSLKPQLQGIIPNRTNKTGKPYAYPWLTIMLTKPYVPSYVIWGVIALLLCLSGLFSGLNLGILSLDKMDLKIMINTGTPRERAHARKIRPIRRNGNLLLCSLVFSNVLVNSTLTLLLDTLTDGVTAVVVSTLAIVIMGEIIPQAVCCRHGLAIAGYTIVITRFFMIITFPMAIVTSKVLDWVLGEEIGAGFTRERLKELLRAVKDDHILENEEVGMISGALDLKQKTVKQIMKKIADVFMLPVDSTLDYKTMRKIELQGYSRIPIYEGEVTNVVAVLNVKQLIMVNYREEIALKRVIDLEYYRENLFCVFENTRLDFMFRKFREGDRGHMAFVERVNDEGPGNPFYERIGVVTLEDVLEELLQQEIMDESDVGSTYKARLEHHIQVLHKLDSFNRLPPPVPEEEYIP